MITYEGKQMSQALMSSGVASEFVKTSDQNCWWLWFKERIFQLYANISTKHKTALQSNWFNVVQRLAELVGICVVWSYNGIIMTLVKPMLKKRFGIKKSFELCANFLKYTYSKTKCKWLEHHKMNPTLTSN